ncbi:MAG: LysM peptidoglycan-binding domain-containing protein [Methylophilaceae bacterium]
MPAIADDGVLRKNHPDRHVVVKGDTLWGISAKFLENPWLWPEVWQMNRAEIHNPHLIYPGDVVMLDYVNGQPQLRLLKETTSLTPGIRVEALDREAVPTISPNVIEPFLSKPLIIENGELKQAVSIIAGQQNRVVLAQGDKAYADQINEGSESFWHVYREGKPLVDPVAKETLGIEAIYLGDAKVTHFGEPATLEILRTKQEILVGDKLLEAPESSATNFIPRAPETAVVGRILSIYGGIAEAGNNAIVTLNRGKIDGMEPGHVLAIYREGKQVKKSAEKIKELESAGAYKGLSKEAKRDLAMIKLPDERVGLLMVFRTFNRVSYALVMQAAEPVNVLDIVQTP